MDGYLKIKTKIDNSGIDKDVSELENKIKKLQKENTNKSNERSSLQNEINEYEKLQQQADKYRQEIKELTKEKQNLSTGQVGGLSNTKVPEYSKISQEIEKVNVKYKQITAEIDKQAPKIDKVYTKLARIKDKQTENNTKIEQFKKKIEQIKLDKVRKEMDTVGNSIQSSIGKIGKMAMAVVGIRSAWMLVRSAMNAAKEYNPQIVADFEYMRYCLVSLVIPAVQALIRLLYTVLGYVNAIVSAWFGINLFGNASVKNFQKMQKSASGTAKAAKEIQKSLQGFDEMNVLSDNASSSGGGGVAGATPSTDLSMPQGEVPAWLQWIIDNKDIVIAALAGIAGGLLALKLGFSGIQSLGIGIAIMGLVSLIQNIMTFLNDPTWENFSNVLLSLSVVLGGIALVVRRNIRGYDSTELQQQ